MCETLETRRLMSTTAFAAEGPEPVAIGMLLPAVQAAREAARSSPTTTGGPGGGPSVKVFSAGSIGGTSLPAVQLDLSN